MEKIRLTKKTFKIICFLLIVFAAGVLVFQSVVSPKSPVASMAKTLNLAGNFYSNSLSKNATVLGVQDDGFSNLPNRN